MTTNQKNQSRPLNNWYDRTLDRTIGLKKGFHSSNYWLNFRQIVIGTAWLSGLVCCSGYLSICQSAISAKPRREVIAVDRNTQLITETLPPPPQIGSDRNSLFSPSRDRHREYIFQKPATSSSSSTNISTFDRKYLVEVYGDTELILHQVKQLEPQAFRKGRFIQVGIFSQQENAEEIVRKLESYGLRGRITAVFDLNK